MTFQNPIQQGVKSTWQAILALGVLSIILGITFAFSSSASTLAIGILFGIYLLISGAFQVIAGILGETQHRVLTVISGAISIILGVTCFRDDVINSVVILGIWIGISWIFSGVTSIVVAATDRLHPSRVWAVLLGIISVAGGAVLITYPFAVETVVWVAGIWAIAIGVVQVISAFQLRSAAKNVHQHVTDALG